MSQQIIKYCQKCKDFQFFEWQIEQEDKENNNLDFWLMCCACGFTAQESQLDAQNPNYPHLLEKVSPEAIETAIKPPRRLR